MRWLLLVVPTLAWAAPGPSDPVLARTAPDLRPLAVGPVPPEGRLQLAIDVAVDVDAAVVAEALAGIDTVSIEVIARDRLQLRVDARHLRRVASTDGVRRVRRPYRASAKAYTEGYDFVFAEDWHAHGVRGQGVDIAILDVGFLGYAELLGDDLPAALETSFVAGGADSVHGTGVAEIIHDIAPAATLTLYDFDTDVEFFAQVAAIAAQGPDLVNASIGFDNLWHADDTSPWTVAVNDLVDGGVTWVSAAGNEDDSYWVGTLSDVDGDGWMEFDGGDEFLTAFPDGDGDLGVSLRWDEPFGAAGRDLDLVVEDCGESDAQQDGDDEPFERVICQPGASGRVKVKDYNRIGTDIKAWVYVFYGDWDDGIPTRFSTLTLPADSSGAISVGAYSLAFDNLTSYSSTGPTDDGRLKPDLTAPTDVSTEAYGPGEFNGTSAAAPHVTGTLALAISGDGVAADPDLLRAWLMDHVVDMGPAGPDNWWGHGLLQVDGPPTYDVDASDTGPGDTGAPAVACACRSASGPSGLAVIPLALLAWRRRRP